MQKKLIVSFILIFIIIMLLKLLKISTLFGALALPFTQNEHLTRPETMEAPAKQSLYDFKMIRK